MQSPQSPYKGRKRGKGVKGHTRQTTQPQRRHSRTQSLAQKETLPDVIRSSCRPRAGHLEEGAAVPPGDPFLTSPSS